MKYRSTIAVILAASAAYAEGLARVPAGTEPPPQLKDVGVDQKLNAQLPLEAEFLDEEGKSIRLGQLFGRRPVVLALVYYECPMLCTMVLNGTLRAARALQLNAGTDYDVVAISFDAEETPALALRKKEEYIERYNRPGAERGWHFLTGSPASIKAVTEAAGYRFSRDPSNGQWAHASAIMVATPEGRLARYFYGVEYSARDLRFSLVEASQGKIGTPVDQVLLYCFHYDPATGKYSLVIMNILRAAGALTVAALLLFWFVQSRRGRSKQNHVELPIIS
ncbi:MAG: SCO family protein [Bryobacteraceae bacterium]